MKDTFRSQTNWHLKTAGEVFEILRSAPEGLVSQEANKRLEEYGPNLLTEKKKRSPFALFLDQFKDFMILVLIGAAVISGLMGEAADTVAIVVILILNALIGFTQEYRAEKAMAALKNMAAPLAVVIRGGKSAEIAAWDLVPGDMVVLDAGRIVPADVRINEAFQFRTVEAALTGEAAPVEKITTPLHEEASFIGDRKNMAFKGTTVSYGRGRGIVVATGMDTEIGKIASMLQEEEEGKTPLQKRVSIFGRKLALAVLVICAIIFGVGILRGGPVLLMFLTAVSLAVAAIPEALPAVVTISLAIGAKKMVRNNALI